MITRIQSIAELLLLVGAIALVAGLTDTASGQVVLNEVMADNTGAVIGPSGNSPDYVELFNASVSPVLLSGWTLSDTPAVPARFSPHQLFLTYIRPGSWRRIRFISRASSATDTPDAASPLRRMMSSMWTSSSPTAS